MAANTTTQVHCPQLVCAGCGGQEVTATYKARTVEVAPCESLKAQGWHGDVQVVLWHNQALERLVPVAPVAMRHRDGLVAIG